MAAPFDELVEGGGETGEVELGAVEEIEGVRLEGAVGIALEVRVDVVEDGGGIVKTLVDVGE